MILNTIELIESGKPMSQEYLLTGSLAMLILFILVDALIYKALILQKPYDEKCDGAYFNH